MILDTIPPLLKRLVKRAPYPLSQHITSVALATAFSARFAQYTSSTSHPLLLFYQRLQVSFFHHLSQMLGVISYLWDVGRLRLACVSNHVKGRHSTSSLALRLRSITQFCEQLRLVHLWVAPTSNPITSHLLSKRYQATEDLLVRCPAPTSYPTIEPHRCDLRCASYTRPAYCVSCHPR